MAATTGPGGPVGLDTLVQELRGLAQQAGDGSGYFPALYAGVTAEIARRVAAGPGGGFAEPVLLERLATGFAALYTGPRTGRVPAPRCWRAAWDVGDDPRLLVVQHLLLGINAHVNHDLPLAVVALADETGDLPGLRADFDAVNDVLAQAYVTSARRLGRATRWVGTAAALGGERLFRFSLTRARAQAWSAAQRLHPLDAAGRRAYAVELDRLVSVLAHLVAVPAPPLSWLLRPVRALEEQDPAVVTALLLDG